MKLVGGKIIKVSGVKITENVQHTGMKIGINVDYAKSEKGRLVVGYTIKNLMEPDVAELIVSGEFYYELDEKKLKAALDEWDKKKTLDMELTENALNAANYSMGAVGTLLAFALGIPAPISTPLARVTPPEQSGGKAS